MLEGPVMPCRPSLGWDHQQDEGPEQAVVSAASSAMKMKAPSAAQETAPSAYMRTTGQSVSRREKAARERFPISAAIVRIGTASAAPKS